VFGAQRRCWAVEVVGRRTRACSWIAWSWEGVSTVVWMLAICVWAGETRGRSVGAGVVRELSWEESD